MFSRIIGLVLMMKSLWIVSVLLILLLGGGRAAPLCAEEGIGLDLLPIQPATWATLETKSTALEHALAGFPNRGVVDGSVRTLTLGLVQELRTIETTLGLRSLEQQSHNLLEAGHRALRAGDLASASDLVRAAVQLSPEHPKVLLASVPLARATSAVSVRSLVQEAVSRSLQYPGIALEVLTNAVYPFLWAATIALYGVILFFLIANIPALVRGVAKFLPTWLTGLVAPLVVAVGIISPCLLSPLWCLATWAVVIAVFVPDRRWLTFGTGVMLTLWGSAIPLRENISVWLGDERMQTVLAVLAGDGRTTAGQLEELASLRPNDPLVYYAYGELLRQSGSVELAGQVFTRAEDLLGIQPYTVAARGVAAYLGGRLQEADRLLTKAEEMGLDSAELWFNLSKVKFDLVQPGRSEAYLAKAETKDSRRVHELRAREETLGLRHPLALGAIELPVASVVRSALLPMRGTMSRHDRVAATVMTGATPWQISLVGGALMVLFLVRGRSAKRKAKFHLYYTNFEMPRAIVWLMRLVPGGALVLRDRVLPAWGLMMLMVALVMPLLAWPAEASVLQLTIQALFPGYQWFVLLVALLCVGISGLGWIGANRRRGT